ncbi:protein transport protein S31, partial [Coemansia sp. RSA 2424]
RQSEAGLARTKSLHSLIEKVSVFRKAVQFVDPALTAADNESSFVLASLYDCYVEYAQFLVSQGLIDIAVKYLDRVPDTYRCVLPTTGGEDVLAALRNRLALTTEAPWTAVSIGPVAQQQQQQQPIQQQPIQQQPIQQQPIQPVQPMQPMQPMQPAYGGYSQTYPAASTNMPAATHYPSQNMPSAATAAYPGGFAGMSQQQQQLGPYGGVGMFQPPPPMPVNPATIPTGRTPPPRRDDVPWNDPPPMLAKPAKRPSQAVAHAKPAAIVSPFPQGRDTPPPPPPQHLQQQQQQQPPQAMGPPRGGFVPSAAQIGKPLPPPPPPPSAPQLMQQQQQHPGMQQQPMQPGFVPQPQQQQMMPMMSSMQQTAPPPQSMRGQVVTAGPSTGTAGPAVRTGTPAAMSRDSVATAAALAAGAAAAAASASASAAAKYPAGDRSHLPDAWKPAVSGLTAHLSRAKQFAAPGQKRMVEDAERRLNALFDLMNCDDVKMKDRLVPVFDQLVQAINSRHFPTALTLQAEIMALNPDITTNVVGVKHLVNVLKTLPM